jgi:hypothetical protein
LTPPSRSTLPTGADTLRKENAARSIHVDSKKTSLTAARSWRGGGGLERTVLGGCLTEVGREAAEEAEREGNDGLSEARANGGGGEEAKLHVGAIVLANA